MVSLDDRLDSFAEAWRPEVGDKLIGTVIGVDMRDSDYGDPYPIIEVETDEGGQFAFHGFHTIARRELAKKQPQVGDRIGIKYYGRGEPAKPGMSGAEKYKILVEKAEPKPVDWSEVAVDVDAEDGVPF
jgi:hypothetical protein